jgi:hypothetical protein
MRSALVQTAQYPDIGAAFPDSENFVRIKMSFGDLLKAAAARPLTILWKRRFG